MNRAELFEHVSDRYGVRPDHPWPDSPNLEVLRHADNRKWFGIVMDVLAFRLGLPGDAPVDVLNVKVDPSEAALLRQADGILPAYHMNKENWISIVIEGGIPDELVLELLETSFDLTR